MVDENLSHHSRGHAEKVSAVLPDAIAIADEAQVSFVDQGGWLERMVRAFAPQIGSGDVAELSLHGPHELLRVLGGPGPPPGKQCCDILPFVSSHLATRNRY